MPGEVCLSIQQCCLWVDNIFESAVQSGSGVAKLLSIETAGKEQSGACAHVDTLSV